MYPIAILILVLGNAISCKNNPDQYVCKPCNLKCDTISFTDPGECLHCNMKLIRGNQQIADDATFHDGSGNFLIEDSRDPLKRIRVFYYKPRGFTENSNILMVIPGAGRNADDYRDSWVEIAEQYDVLILSPEFSELYYSFEDYHLGGVIGKSNLMKHITRIENTNKVKLDEENIEFTINPNPEQWIFGQFDHIFDIAVEALRSNHTTYDLFGHSAGGHILHRMALFTTSEKVNRILASNASFYTLPTNIYSFPFGMKDSPLEMDDLAPAFRNKLVVFLGEEDNAHEPGGTFLISESANFQGNHRLERGNYFYDVSRKTAKNSGCEFNWKLEIIPGIGHNYSKMGSAAGRYLYAN